MTVKLYGIPISTCTCRVLTCLHEKAVEFELIHVDLFNGEHKLPPFLAKNPFAQIPALEDGDLTLFESRAITAYIAEKYRETGDDLLRQQDQKEAAMVKVWSEVESHHYSPAITPIIHQYFTSHLKGNRPDESVIGENVEKLRKVLDVYEERLRSSKFLGGEFYSLADLHHLPFTFYLMKTPWASLVNDRRHVRAWWDDISSRPAFRKVAEGMTFGDDQKST